MAIGRVNAGGGLNFRVTGGTTQPTGRENLIWVNTSATITDWIFCVAQPDGVEGRVWFKVSTFSDGAFNAVKQNGLWVYPNPCKQYISGSWAAKDTQIYSDGAWKEFYQYLYNNGTVSALGSGLGTNSCKWYPGTTYYDIANIQRGADYIRFYSSDTYSHGIAIWTTSKVDLTDFTSLKVNITSASSNNASTIKLAAYISPTLPSNTSSYTNRIAAAAWNLTSGAGVLEVSLSSVTGSYYVILGYSQNGAQSTNTGDVRFNKIWLE